MDRSGRRPLCEDVDRVRRRRCDARGRSLDVPGGQGEVPGEGRRRDSRDRRSAGVPSGRRPALRLDPDRPPRPSVPGLAQRAAGPVCGICAGPASTLTRKRSGLTVRPKTLRTLDVRTPEQWRKWLADHHDSQSEVWLVFHKRHTGRASIAYEDAVDEALCFGWVDSLIKRLDDERYARKFTPRKLDSRWSTVNRERYARLEASGRLTGAGLNRAPTDR